MRFFFCYLLILLCPAVVANHHKVGFFLDPQPSLASLSQVNIDDLCSIARQSLQYLQQHQDDDFAVHAGTVIPKEISLARVKQSLAFICQVHSEDLKNNRPSRLQQADFLLTHFDFYRWQADKHTANTLADNSKNAKKARLLRAIPEKKILLTKYYTKLLKGSDVKTEHYNQALYALPFDEQGLTLEQAEQQKHKLTRFKYSRQDIINGALVKQKLAKPLIWLTEEALHDVLLQGTGVLLVNGKKRYFNVHRNNGISYDYTLGKREQARYWYFAEVPSIMGYGNKLQNKIAIKPYVSFAGNVAELGLGKLFVMTYRHNSYQYNSEQYRSDQHHQQTGKAKQVSQIGVLADQGGAFDGNLFQLDFLVDSYWGWRDYHQANKHLPDYVQAWLMVLKNK